MVFRLGCSADGRIVDANERAINAGFKVGELLQTYLRDFVSKRTWMQMMAEINQQTDNPSRSNISQFQPTITNYSLTIHAPQAAVFCECDYNFDFDCCSGCEDEAISSRKDLLVLPDVHSNHHHHHHHNDNNNNNTEHGPAPAKRWQIQLTGIASHQPYYTAAHLNQVKERQYLYDIENLDYNLNAVIATDMTGKIIYANETVTDLYGWKPHEIIGRSVVETMSSDLDRERGDQIWKALVKGMSWAGDFICKHRDGSDVPTRTTDYPIFSNEHKLIGILGVSCRVGPVEEDSSTSADIAAPTADNFYDKEQQTAITTTATNNTVPTCVVFQPQQITDATAGGNNNHQCGDVSQNSIKALLLLGPCPLATDDRFVIRWFNKGLIDHFFRSTDGTAAESMIGRNPMKLPALRFDQWLSGKVVDSRGRPMNVCSIDLPSERCRLYILCDATLQQRLEVSLKAAADTAEQEAFKMDFITTMSHEMRTPLHGIIGECENLEWLVLQNNQQSIPAPLKAAIIESIRIINGSSKIQLQLVNNVLEWQKLSANKVVVDRSDFDLRKTIHAVAYNFRCLLRLRGLTVDMEVDPAVPLIIRTDQLKIQQILINYLSNAIKYTRENTRISIRAVPASAQQPSDISGKSVVALPLISILVQDQGAGVVGAEQQQQLFRRFAQLTNSLQANGSGIGLSVCQQLAEMLGGRVWYEHPARFWCSFTYEPSPFTGQLDSPVSNELIGYGGIKRKLSDVDVAETAAAAAADLDCPPSKIINSSLQRSAEPEKGSQKLSNQHSSSIDHEKWCPILIVEDNLINQKVLVKMLQKLGFRRADIDLCSDGLQALDAAAHRCYPLIFMDVSMPNMDGIQATIELRRRKCGAKIIGVSANAMSEHKNAGMTAGMDGFLVKPIQSSDISGFLDSII